MSDWKSILDQNFGNSSEIIKIYSAPARINIIGEHVDYLGGLVFPAAINFQVEVAVRKNLDNQIRLYSNQYKEVSTSNFPVKQSQQSWANYIYGVVHELAKDGFLVSGFDMAIDGNIPQGAGLSSSAALEVAVGFALSDLFGFSIPREKIAVLGKLAENNFVGTMCGIMDQFIIATGKSNHAILLNTETLKYSYHTLNLGDYEFSIINSAVKHSLKDSDYNTRRKECESALAKLKTKFPELKELYDFSEEKLSTEGFKSAGLTHDEIKRVKHVVGEKRRTTVLIQAMKEGNLSLAGECLYEAHDSLSKLFEVSCIETDALVEMVKERGAIGARMIGGGFGGCILVLDHKGKMDKIQKDILANYKKKFDLDGSVFLFKISDGVKRIQ